MSNTTDNMAGYGARGDKRCRIAYILNNSQPVRCSYISDQPLFYMDFAEEDTAEDSGLFDFTQVEAGVAALSERVAALQSLEGRFEESGIADRFADFTSDLAFACEESQAGEPADIKFLESVFRKSRLGASMLDLAAKYGTKLQYDNQTATAQYDRRSGNVCLNPRLKQDDLILLAARELRRAWQHRNGALINPLMFHPDQAVLVNRAQIADLAVIMVRVAWELQLAGEKSVWERLESSSLEDLGRAFAREAYLDFRTLNNGVAQSAVFESWFLSERCRYEDKKLIQMMLADYHGYVFDSAQSSQSVTADLIVALGSMPFGKNYLAPYVSTIMNDAIFTEVRDRSNANFLWFIKFERSFRETEQELQASRDTSGRENQHGHINNKKRFGDHEETEIISLPFGRADNPSPQAAHEQGPGNIIPFRNRSGKG